MSEASANNRRRSMSTSANEPSLEELRAVRRQFSHTRSESAGSSRVSSIRDEYEQLASSSGPARPATGTPALPPPVPALPAMTPKSKKVAQIRERIEEWQRAEHAPGSWSDPASRRTTTDSGTGSSATAQGAQQQIGEIESVGASSSAARSQSQQSNQQPSQQPVEQMAQQPRLVPLTPEVQRRGKAPARTAPKAIAGRSDTRASRESKFSVQSSNVPPSLFGSDRSTFSSPLLGPLPHMSVPSDIASLRTAAASQTLPRESEPPAPVRVQQAVASPVSIGGRKKQSLVVDARSASDEVLLDTQSVKSASPSVVHTSSSSSPSSGVFT
ncbi:hypothetical protein GGH98_006471, partial [Coemansia sp. RSA 454]